MREHLERTMRRSCSEVLFLEQQVQKVQALGVSAVITIMRSEDTNRLSPLDKSHTGQISHQEFAILGLLPILEVVQIAQKCWII